MFERFFGIPARLGKNLPHSSGHKPVEDDFLWQPYFYAVINQTDVTDCSIVSPEKGLPELEGVDIVMAAKVVEYMRKELQAQEFRRNAPEDQFEKVMTVFEGLDDYDDEGREEKVVRTVHVPSLVPFDIEERLNELVCVYCAEQNSTLCVHGDSTIALN